MSILVIVPSRGRPERLAAMLTSVHEMAESEVNTYAVLDADDPFIPAYAEQLGTDQPYIVLAERVGYTGSLNDAAAAFRDTYSILGAFGDDVLFRTPGWDRIVEETLADPGVAYGDDLIHGVNHPSAVFMSSVIAGALGWLALPATSHQWADDGWKRLGQETGLLRYMPDVVVEHMHPAVDKAEWDDTYRSVFDEDRAKRDYEGFTNWANNGGLAADAAKVRAGLGMRP